MLPASFFDTIQKACLPGIWSKGVTLSRSESVVVDSMTDEEVVLRVRSTSSPASKKVTLWPTDDDWHCDCRDKNSVCEHVVASVISLKSGRSPSTPTSEATENRKVRSTQISYRFSRTPDGLALHRWVLTGDGKSEPLQESLVALAGGIRSGRIQAPALLATQDEYKVDSILNTARTKVLDPTVLPLLFKFLAGNPACQWNEKTLSISATPLKLRATVSDENRGFRLKQAEEPSITEVFRNGAVLCGDTLRPIEIPPLTSQENALLSGAGTFFPFEESAKLVTEIIPSLERKLRVEILTSSLPQIKKMEAKIRFQFSEDLERETLSVTPFFEKPKTSLQPQELHLADSEAEKALTRKLQQELQLSPGQTVQFQGDAAADFLLRLQQWNTRLPNERTDTASIPFEQFPLDISLTPHLAVEGQVFDFQFQSSESSRAADSQSVFRAWRENRDFVPLLGGGWAPLPKDWLNRYGERILAILDARTSSQELPPFSLPGLAHLLTELEQPVPTALAQLQHLLEHVDEIQKVNPPSDFKAELRHYQQQGVNWLFFLKQMKMGALLADDMGLGKTIQALCVIEGRTLIVAPTSVLFNWAQHLKEFRPGLSVGLYHGNERSLDSSKQVTLTSYGLLRLDKELLAAKKWDTVILDEAQMIKNPTSQIAQAAYALNGDFKLALTGTPIENRLGDLWSQFQFLNPGLLGSLETFEQNHPNTRDKIKPFILRRLKREVVPELPEKTEINLYCELSEKEQDLYDAILAAARKEVLSKLETSGNVFAALEQLLRLRQACCHRALVPGGFQGTEENPADPSSKVELLLQTLENSIGLDHRSLVFSQWTSFLDLIESQLKKHQISYLRLDGNTKNREEIVRQFQTNSEISVLLLSLKAGGVGLNLTAADHVFLMDPWWNPQAEDQAADRAHRIGQKNPVLVHRMIAKDTVEEKILVLQQAKLALAASVLEGASAAASITREDILALLQE